MSNQFQNFTDEILNGVKTIETRDSHSLDAYLGHGVAIIRAGTEGGQKVVGYVTNGDYPIEYKSKKGR